mgnify:CR=1 FL=1
MTGWAPRRFWKASTVAPRDGGFADLLDDRPLHTPARRPALLPARALAEAVAAEWDAQEGTLAPATMPLTRLVNAALDTVSEHRAQVIAATAAFGETDLTCYRAAHPQGLAHRQAVAWDGLLDWLAGATGARLCTVCGVTFAPQPPEALACLRDTIAAHDDFALTALHELTSLSGSLVIGLAAARGARDLDALWQAARIDEDWQAEQWGRDDEAEAAAADRKAAFLRAHDFLTLSRPGI